jgi:hypothetical protein
VFFLINTFPKTFDTALYSQFALLNIIKHILYSISVMNITVNNENAV